MLAGAYYADAGVRYVCVAGRAVRGRPRSGKERTLNSYAHDSYMQVGGGGDPWAGVPGGSRRVSLLHWLKAQTPSQPPLPSSVRLTTWPLHCAWLPAAHPQVCGAGDGVEGDCVVPLSAAHLQGATNLTLHGVMHSMSRIGTFDEEAGEGAIWYGSGQVCDLWLHHLADPEGPGAEATVSLLSRDEEVPLLLVGAEESC